VNISARARSKVENFGIWHITTFCHTAKFGRYQLISDGSQGWFRYVNPPGTLPPVDKKSETRLTGPVNRGVLFKVN
jgi:hypothetical protein